MLKCAVCQVECTLRCARCQGVAYCGAQHQRAHWSTHKPSCNANARAQSSTSTSTGASQPRTTPRTAAERGGPTLNVHSVPVGQSPASMMSALTPFPDTLSKDETYQRLIDAFRLWCDDMAIWRGETYGLYNEDDPYPEFVKFAKKARKHLPLWWTNADDKAVLKMSREHDWANIAYAVEKSDINEHYGSGMFAMGLRMWTEKVTGIRIA